LPSGLYGRLEAKGSKEVTQLKTAANGLDAAMG